MLHQTTEAPGLVSSAMPSAPGPAVGSRTGALSIRRNGTVKLGAIYHSPVDSQEGLRTFVLKVRLLFCLLPKPVPIPEGCYRWLRAESEHY